jgi:aprataxin
LHVISSDLTASALKTKRHYNSFSPRVGFFIPLTKVRAWFEDANESDVDRQLLARVRFISTEPIGFRVIYVRA